MKRYSVVIAIAALGVVALSAALNAAPKPSPVPVKWELDISYRQPMPITVTDADGTERLYWYVLYTVANNSGQDRMFVPQISLYTDTGKLYRGSDAIYPTVFSAIQLRHSGMFLKDLSRIAGRILQGDDNALEGVAIFPDFDREARKIDIFFGGLSGETAEVELPNPITLDQPQNDGTTKPVEVKTLTLHKTLQVTWEFPGVSGARQSLVPERLSEQWVMR